MEALILAIILTYAIKKAAEDAHLHWQGSKSANRKASAGKPVRQRAASAARHDAAYWARQAGGGFPEIRHGLFMAWHAGRLAQLEGAEERARARADRAHLRARVTQAVREQRRRQAEALARVRAAAAASLAPDAAGIVTAGPEPRPAPTRRVDGQPETDADRRFFNLRESGFTGPIDQDGYPAPSSGDNGTAPVTPQPPTEGTTGMSGDTTYNQQMSELEALRRDAEEEVNSIRRQRMTSRLDTLQGMGLDSASLAEAAEIDDALRDLEKAAQRLLDATDAAIAGLAKRHEGIQEAVDNAPVDKPAKPEFYES